MGLNEQLKADLETGQTKFASAAVELQTIKDEIDLVAQNLSPEEQKWVGAASSGCQETLRAFDDASLDAITAMGDTAFAIKEMRQGIIDAEEEAARDAKKEEIANIVILVLSVVYLPLAGEAAGGTLEAQSASKAVKMLIDLDQRIAALFRRIAAAMKKFGNEFKTDLPEASTIDPIEVSTQTFGVLENTVAQERVVGGVLLAFATTALSRLNVPRVTSQLLEERFDRFVMMPVPLRLEHLDRVRELSGPHRFLLPAATGLPSLMRRTPALSGVLSRRVHLEREVRPQFHEQCGQQRSVGRGATKRTSHSHQ